MTTQTAPSTDELLRTLAHDTPLWYFLSTVQDAIYRRHCLEEIEGRASSTNQDAVYRAEDLQSALFRLDDATDMENFFDGYAQYMDALPAAQLSAGVTPLQIAASTIACIVGGKIPPDREARWLALFRGRRIEQSWHEGVKAQKLLEDLEQQ